MPRENEATPHSPARGEEAVPRSPALLLLDDEATPCPAREDEAAPHPAGGDEASPRSCMRRGDVTSSRVGKVGRLVPHGKTRHRLVTCRETLVSTLPPGSGRSAYRYPVGPVRTARIGQYNSKRKTLEYTTLNYKNI
ncbi:hypothetical protein B296_00047574 [Ensete ventricosum]|uniref:Uncharacterized protein n=1 Tax=Ensete ventricosum TaxID=4639 RepID=A0A426YYW7_ENSVE|nr:hypothetical protein B296_00047574 [Ensete ventricosum]